MVASANVFIVHMVSSPFVPLTEEASGAAVVSTKAEKFPLLVKKTDEVDGGVDSKEGGLMAEGAGGSVALIVVAKASFSTGVVLITSPLMTSLFWCIFGFSTGGGFLVGVFNR